MVLKKSKKEKKTKNMRKMLPYYARNKKLLFGIVVCMLFLGSLGILTPIFSAKALAELAYGNFDNAIRLAIIMCALGLTKTLFGMLSDIVYTKTNIKLRINLTFDLVNSINRTKMKVLDNSKLGSIAGRLSNDVSSVSDAYLRILDLVFDIISNFVFLIYIAFLNFYIFLILMVYIIICFVISTIRNRIWIKGNKIWRKQADEARSLYFEQINGIRDVKLLNIKNSVTGFANEKFEKSQEFGRKITLQRSSLRHLQNAISIGFELLFLVLGIIFVRRDLLLLSGLLVIYTYYNKVGNLVSYTSMIREYYAEGEVSATRIFEVIDDYKKESFGNETLKEFSGKIEFKNVEFSYNENQKVLKNLNIDFEPGKTTAIVGKSGTGKTTILNLISKLYDVTDGEILLDCNNINSLTENSIRDNIGEVSQSPYIFNASIRQNLLFSKPDATDEELEEVLKISQIWDDIQVFPEKIDAEIGENGIKLSGGQKQRLAIARLLLKNSKVIVFDEATSALDNERQNKIIDLLNKLKKDKTIIIVAHRLSSIVSADKIYVLKEGQIIDSGTHKTLMQTCKEYKELYKLEEKSSME